MLFRPTSTPALHLLRNSSAPTTLRLSLSRSAAASLHAMLSTRLTRAGPRATTVILSSSSICTDGGPRTGQGLTVARPRHQRRPSSSKASTPPHNNASKPAPAAKTGGSKAAPAAAIGSASESKSNSKGRPRGSGLRRKNADSVDQFAGLPSVPSIQSLETKGGSEWHGRLGVVMLM